MPKYSVAIQVFATMDVQVVADSEEGARTKAESEAYEPTLCHQCADEIEIDGIGDIAAVELMRP